MLHNEVYRSWEQIHRREDAVPPSFVWVLINPVLDAEGETSLTNPVEGRLLVSLLFDRDLESLNCALVWPA
jgi:hypothetical protein